MITVGSLFSGIGGIDLGLERAGMTVKWQSEIEPYSCRVLKKHWPDVPNLGDIKNIDWKNVEVVDVIAGGYPCQPFSTAGKRNGTADPRHLWPEMLRAISTIRPRIAFMENVRGHYSLGFDSVLSDLTEIGYDAQWETISALSVGAPHLRQRIICLAYPNSTPRDLKYKRQISQPVINGLCEDVAHPTCKCSNGELDYSRNSEQPKTETKFRDSGRSENRIGQWWEVEPSVGRMADGVPARVDRLRGLGNAVVPQVAETVGRIIHQLLA